MIPAEAIEMALFWKKNIKCANAQRCKQSRRKLLQKDEPFPEPRNENHQPLDQDREIAAEIKRAWGERRVFGPELGGRGFAAVGNGVLTSSAW